MRDVREFVGAFTAEWNRAAAELNAEHATLSGRLAAVQRKIARIIDAITEGFRTPEMKEQLETLNAQKTALQAKMTAPQVSVPALHPNLAEIYRAKVSSLHEALTDSGNDNSHSAVLECLRDLIERVDLGASDQNGEPEIILTGALAAMVRLAMGDGNGAGNSAGKRANASIPGMFDCSVKVVAWARNHRQLTPLMVLC